MNQEKPLLSDFLQRLKETTPFDKFIAIFYNDWSLNPYDDDDYSERVGIKTAMLSKINPNEFQSYRVLWYDQYIFNPGIIEICVKKIKEDKDE